MNFRNRENFPNKFWENWPRGAKILGYQRHLPLENEQFGAFPNKYWEIWVAQISHINTVDQIPQIWILNPLRSAAIALCGPPQ